MTYRVKFLSSFLTSLLCLSSILYSNADAADFSLIPPKVISGGNSTANLSKFIHPGQAPSYPNSFLPFMHDTRTGANYLYPPDKMRNGVHFSMASNLGMMGGGGFTNMEGLQSAFRAGGIFVGPRGELYYHPYNSGMSMGINDGLIPSNDVSKIFQSLADQAGTQVLPLPDSLIGMTAKDGIPRPLSREMAGAVGGYKDEVGNLLTFQPSNPSRCSSVGSKFASATGKAPGGALTPVGVISFGAEMILTDHIQDHPDSLAAGVAELAGRAYYSTDGGFRAMVEAPGVATASLSKSLWGGITGIDYNRPPPAIPEMRAAPSWYQYPPHLWPGRVYSWVHRR